MTQVISSVLYRIANRKRSMVAHHDSLKLCSDRVLPIWLLRKRHELTGEDVGDRVLKQFTDALRDPDEYGDDDNQGLEDLFAERTEEGYFLKDCLLAGVEYYNSRRFHEQTIQ